MKLDIPDPDRTLLARWLGSDDEPIEEVLATLERMSPVLQPESLVRRVAAVTNIDLNVAKDLIRAFFRLARTVSRFSPEEGKDAIANILHAIMGDVVDSERLETFQRRVERVLQTKSIEITAKALSVSSDHANIFCTARTLSDLRPVFSDDQLEPMVAVVVHQLKLVFYAGPEGKEKEIYVALDRKDLEELKIVIERAIAKHEKLEALTKTLELPLLVDLQE